MIDTKASKATRLAIFSLSSPQMRAFHLSWLAFFVCFFAWFAVAPLMPIIKADLRLTKDQIANVNIAAVVTTIAARLFIGPLCDKYGPRLVYTTLLAVGSVPVFGIALTTTYPAFLLCRLLIGAIGASFVVTQVHTSVNFAPNVVGTANATSAGWGNAGGGVTQSTMPWVLAGIVALGVGRGVAWRLAMVLPGTLMLLAACAYARWTQDCPQGNYRELRARGIEIDGGKKGGWDVLSKAAGNYRAWMLFVTYSACFGLELFVHGVAASYYVDRYGFDLKNAGMAAGTFGLLAVFARPLGGWLSDRLAHRRGLDARTTLLFALMLGEGIGLLVFSSTRTGGAAVIAMIAFGLFTHTACGATYALVPFIDRKALGGVAGIVGAGGNVGAVAAGFLLKYVPDVARCFTILGAFALSAAFCAIAVRFSPTQKASEKALHAEALAARKMMAPAAVT
jgi:NNP family nitrate/nitrite transporter-like MFS transporter